MMTAESSKNVAVHTLLLTTPETSISLQIPENLSVREVLDMDGVRVRAACGGLGTCGACLIQTVNGQFCPLTLPEYQKIPPQDREANIRLACQLYLKSDAEVHLENPAPLSDWRSFDVSDWPPPPCSPPMLEHDLYGIAVDFGTTHIRLSVWDRQSGHRISCRHGNNPQVAAGADVLTRLDTERRQEGELASLMRLGREAIIDGIRDILSRDMGEITPILEDTGQVMIVGNTAMLSLLGGHELNRLYNPDNWENPIDCRVNDLEAWKKSWRMPHADIVLQQPIAGFIGSDMLADLLATGMTDSKKPSLMADFGTNIEIALWDGEKLWLTSVPGGSAFETIGLANGLSAEAGAIVHVKKREAGFFLETIGNKKPKGFCAPGFVDAIALLRAGKVVKRSGRFFEKTGEHGYLLDPENPRTGIKAHDIDAFQRAKAAAAAAMQQLLSEAGLTQQVLETVWICGTFGQHLDIPKAQAIGLIPSLPAQRILLFENAALAGCEAMLLDAGSEKRLQMLRKRCTVINMTTRPDYDGHFINNLCLQPLPKEKD